MTRIGIGLRLVMLALLGVGLSACSGKTPAAKAVVAKAPMATSVTDLDGHRANPMAGGEERRGTVLLFITNDCPISNGYAPEIHRLCDAYSKQGMKFCLVYSDPALSLADAKKHYSDYGYQCIAVMDPKHELARRAGATVTPEAAVFNADGARIYLGRINDLYVDYGKARFNPTSNDLRDVLEMMVQGKPVVARTTPAIGCAIPL